MKKSTKFSDVLHILLHMASTQKPATSEKLAKSIQSNPAFVRRVLAGLRELGLIQSEKGHRGGWLLSCNLADVTLYDIYQAVGTPTMLAIGNRSDASMCLVEQAVNETTGHVFERAESLISEELKKTTLAELNHLIKKNGWTMKNNKKKIFDVIIVGGSYAGLSAAMNLGRSLRSVLIIDSNDPCNKQTPHSHNFITHDGSPPGEIASQAKLQVQKYDTVAFASGLAIKAQKMEGSFLIGLESGEEFEAKKLLFTTGLRDIMPTISGFAECWGISILHCPYCHGYEVKDQQIALLAKGTDGFHLAQLIGHWSTNLTLFSNGKSNLNPQEKAKLEQRNIAIVEKEIQSFEHDHGQLKQIVFKDGSKNAFAAAFAKVNFEQKSDLPHQLGCELTEHGFIKIDELQKTTIAGIYAAGDNSYGLRSVSVATGAGTKAGVFINSALLQESF